MQITKERKKLYPKNWKYLSEKVRREARWKRCHNRLDRKFRAKNRKQNA